MNISANKRLYTIIVNWNGLQDTLVCLESLTRAKRQGIDNTVVVVDNGSTDDSVTTIRSGYPQVTVIPTRQNLGFTGGNNMGITYALGQKAEYVWMLNNDTIVDKDVLSFMDGFTDDRVGACGSKIYFAKGHEYHKNRYSQKDTGNVLWYAGGLVDWGNMYASHRGVDEVDTGQYDTVQETSFITGCSFAIRSKVLTKVGLLDDKYYLYLEDLDLSLRIRNAGYTLLYVPKSKLWHINAGSSGKPGNPLHEYYFTRNRLLTGFRYAPFRTKAALAREAIRFVFGKSYERRIAVADAVLGRFGRQYEPKKTH